MRNLALTLGTCTSHDAGHNDEFSERRRGEHCDRREKSSKTGIAQKASSELVVVTGGRESRISSGFYTQKKNAGKKRTFFWPMVCAHRDRTMSVSNST